MKIHWNEKTRVHFLNAPTLFGVASDVRSRAMEKHDEREHFDEGLIGVVFAAFSIESFFNELPVRVFPQHEAEPHPYLGRLIEVMNLAEEANLGVRLKADLAAITLTGRPFDHGEQPYQGFSMLLRVRHEIVHMRPQKGVIVPEKGALAPEGGDEFAIHGTGAILESEPIRRLCDERPGLPITHRLATPGMVDWACRAAIDIVQATAAMLPEECGDVSTALRREFSLEPVVEPPANPE